MAADHREVVERGLTIKRIGNRILALLGGRADPPGQRPGRRLLRGPAPGRARGAPPDARGRRSRPRSRPSRSSASFSAPDFDARADARRAPPPDRVPVQRRPDRLDRRDRPRRSTDWDDAFHEEHHRGHRTRSTPGRTTARSTCSARPPGSPSPRDQLHPLAAEALAATGLARRDPDEHLLEHRGPGDRARRASSPRRSRSSTATGRPDEPAVPLDVATGRGGLGHRGARGACSSTATRSTSAGRIADGPDRPADEPEPGRHRGRPGAASRRASSTCRTPRPRSGWSSSSGATTRASRARPTSST